MKLCKLCKLKGTNTCSYCTFNGNYLNIDLNKIKKKLKKKKNNYSGERKVAMDILGLNITLPYKKDIMKFIDELKPEPKSIDAVNTVEIKNGKWIAHNTDWYGVYKTLEINNINKNHNLLIIGAGGATGAVIYGFKEYELKILH